MSYYNTKYGSQFNTYDEAIEACLCDQDIDDFEEYFSIQVSYTKLLNWAVKQERFFDDFCDEIDKANQEYCDDFVKEYDDEEEHCFEPGRYFKSMFELNP